VELYFHQYEGQYGKWISQEHTQNKVWSLKLVNDLLHFAQLQVHTSGVLATVMGSSMALNPGCSKVPYSEGVVEAGVVVASVVEVLMQVHPATLWDTMLRSKGSSSGSKSIKVEIQDMRPLQCTKTC
jgi:hypothetical protein